MSTTSIHPHTRQRLITVMSWLSIAFCSFSGFPGGAVAADDLSNEEALEIATEAYIYAYPLVIVDVTRQVATNVEEPEATGMFAPMNQFGHAKVFPDATFTAVVRPNADTLYSSLWFDVTKVLRLNL